MSKKVFFSESPHLIRQISDQSEARLMNSQTPYEHKLAKETFTIEENQKYHTDQNIKKKYDNKKTYKNTPINKRVKDAIARGHKEDSNIRSHEHQYDYWWLGGNKKRTKNTKTKHKKTKHKKTKHKKTKHKRTNK